MVTLNKYFLYNYDMVNNTDKTPEFKNLLKNKTYEEVLAYIISKYGEFSTNTKNLKYPDYDQNIQITFNEENSQITFFFEKDDEYIFFDKK